ncbi:MAG: T9SS type A sorting domain-containing protein [Bacteroidales bacterium]|nr:T9SS type A sorting domain-containing protein [Bacteroidales bacterium]MDD3664280.1 T9SS type A sorting domain-containing protein [Bacteroidales bacterium]
MIKQFLFAGLGFFLAGALTAQDLQDRIRPEFTAKPVYADVSPPLRDMPAITPKETGRPWKDGVVKNIFRTPSPELKNVPDAIVQKKMGWLKAPNAIGPNFNGVGNLNGVMPPDTDGDVGLNHYFQMINMSFQIWDKSGTSLLGPVANNTIWQGFTGPWGNSNDGDPIVLYDEYADRWLASQFALPNYPNGPFYMMIAISVTPDPTGQWYRYGYSFTDMPDYPKLGVWHNAYTLTVNRFSSGSTNYVGTAAVAFNRTKMLAGDPNAEMVYFPMSASQEPFGMLPSDADGTTPPPSGSPAYFGYIKSPSKFVVYKMTLDWNNTANSVFELEANIPVTFWSTSISGIPQPGTTRKLDVITDRLMFRLQYRNFGSYQTMVTNHTVNVSGVAGVRWYEFRKSGTSPWSLYQEGTYSPDNINRWMGSIAMDGNGNIAIGYSVANSTVYPGIRFAGRMKNDPLGQMTIAEQEIVAGGGSQTGGFIGNGRWGDYSAMTIDPSAPNTFWFTTEYMQNTSSQGWKTRVAKFSFDQVFGLNITASNDSVCPGDSTQLVVSGVGGSGNYTYTWNSNPSGTTSTNDTLWVKPEANTYYICEINDGSNTAIDSILITVVEPAQASAGDDQEICDNTPVSISGNASLAASTLWTTSGDGVFANPALATTTYTPGQTDISNHAVTLTFHAYGYLGCNEASDDLNLIIHSQPEVSAGADSVICTNWFPFTCTPTVIDGNNIQWITLGDGTFSNPGELAAVYSPGPTDLATGKVQLVLSAEAYTPCSGSVSDTVEFSFDPCTGISPWLSGAKFSVMPNPASGLFNVVITGLKPASSTLSVNSTDGTRWMTMAIDHQSTLVTKIDLRNLPKGTYILTLNNEMGKISQKIIIQ